MLVLTYIHPNSSQQETATLVKGQHTETHVSSCQPRYQSLCSHRRLLLQRVKHHVSEDESQLPTLTRASQELSELEGGKVKAPGTTSPNFALKYSQMFVKRQLHG